MVQEQHKRQESDDRRDLPTRIRQFRRALSAKQLAELLGTTASNILKKAKAGRMPSYRLFGSVKFDPAITAAWLEEQAI